MKQHFFTRLLTVYLLIGGLCFLLLSSAGSYLMEKRLEQSTSESLYEEVTRIAGQKNVQDSIAGNDMESLSRELSAVSAFQDCELWITDASGNILTTASGEHTATGSGSQLRSIVPVEKDQKVIGYVEIHYPMENLYESRSSIVEVMLVIFLVIYLLFFILLLLYFFRIHKPLRQILKGASEFANGNLSYKIPVDSEDEMGYLSHSLNYMADKLNKNGEYQRQFISNVSHDFRSPLTSIKGYVEAMLDGTIPMEMQERYLKIIAFESTRLEKLTRSLLTLNELDVKKRQMHIRRFDINETIRTTAASFERTCQEKAIELKLLLTGTELMVKADMEQIQQVLYNLLDNAVKFSSENSAITLETTVNHGKVFVSVKDQGTGIPKESLSRIWDRFYKIDSSRGKDRKGTGLGLAIVKEIINAHGQNINVISTVGVGTEFIFSLEKAK